MKKIETEKKYIILKIDAKTLEEQNAFTSSEITQIYLSDSEMTHRIRKRVYADGVTEYTENTKKRISVMSSVESENIIGAERFESLKENIEPGSRALKKTRITFEYSSKTFEIDVYPEWKNTCILEVELDREDENIDFPDFLTILADVTGKKEYSNHSMAHRFVQELYSGEK